jgi:hypothetical protein
MTESAVEINLGAETMRCKPFLIAKDTVHKWNFYENYNQDFTSLRRGILDQMGNYQFL